MSEGSSFTSHDHSPVPGSSLPSFEGIYGLRTLREWELNRPRDLSMTKQAMGSESLEFTVEPVESYERLSYIAAFLAVMNKNMILLFRGQRQDFPLLRTLYRSMWTDEAVNKRLGSIAANRAEYWLSLPAVEKKVYEVLAGEGLPRWRHLEDEHIRYARWAVIQHYELWPTPMLDFSTSLRVGASFALGPTGKKKWRWPHRTFQEGYLYIAGTTRLRSDLMPLFRGKKDDKYEIAEGFLSIRLNAVCPPNAVRPHLQEGVLVGLYPVDNLGDLNPDRNNYGKRLIAKIRLVDRGNFWTKDFPCHTTDALLPAKDPLNDTLHWAIGPGL